MSFNDARGGQLVRVEDREEVGARSGGQGRKRRKGKG